LILLIFFQVTAFVPKTAPR